MKTLTAGFISLALAFATAAVQAAGDPAAGKTKSALCAGCHGADGNSASPEFPKLAGQGATYLAKQLRDYKSGKRENAIMSGMAGALSEQDILNLAAFYAVQTIQTGEADLGLVGLGERIYRGGNKNTDLPACMACHGPSGAGNPPAAFPALAGQHAQYTADSLTQFKNEQRANDPNSMMRMTAGKMSAAEIKAVASYLAGLYQ